MGRELNQRLTEWAQWYKSHETDGRSIEQEIAFLKKTVDGILECLAIVASDVQDPKAPNPADELMVSRLFRPKGMVWRR